MRVEGKYGAFGMSGGVPVLGQGAMEVRDDGLVLTGFAAKRSVGSMALTGLAMGIAAGAAAWAVNHFFFAPGSTLSWVGPAIGGAVAGAFLAVGPDAAQPRSETIPWANVKTVKRGAGKGPITIVTQGLHPRGKDKVTFFASGDKDALVRAIDARGRSR